VLSPLLANVYLDHFDRWFAKRALLGGTSASISARARRRKAGHANFLMVRYADDFVIFSNGTKAETMAFKAEVKAWFADELKLTLSEEKTAITHYTDGVDFLGFTVRKKVSHRHNQEVVVYYPSTASVRRATRRIAELTARTDVRRSVEDTIEALNQFLRGWGEYFRHSSASHALSYVGSRAYMRMWKWLVVKHGGAYGWRAVEAKYGRANTWQAGKHRLLVLAALKVNFPRFRKRPHPYLGESPVTDPPPGDPYAARWTGVSAYGEDWTSARETARGRMDGQCVICGNPTVEVHHRKAKANGGGNGQPNLVLLCRRHHRQAERRNSMVSHQLREITLGSGKPDA
jgi:RNA-directed DNA polymerase